VNNNVMKLNVACKRENMIHSRIGLFGVGGLFSTNPKATRGKNNHFERTIQLDSVDNLTFSLTKLPEDGWTTSH